MSKLIKFLLATLFFIFGITIGAKADINPNTNRGNYVYDQNHILTDEQVQRIDQINERMNKGKRAQRLFLFIYSKNPDSSYKFSNFRAFATEDDRISRGIEGAISNKEGEDSVNSLLYSDNKLNKYLMKQGVINVIAYNTSTGKTSFFANSYGNNELFSHIDYCPNRYWHKGLLVFGLHSHIPSLQASAITRYAERQAKPLEEYQRTGNYLYEIFYIFIFIPFMIWLIWKLHKKFARNHPGPNYHDGNQDANYDDGYVDGMIDAQIMNHYFKDRDRNNQ